MEMINIFFVDFYHTPAVDVDSGIKMEKTIAALKERLEKQQKEAAEIKTKFNLQ
jgi:hypothetical protein